MSIRRLGVLGGIGIVAMASVGAPVSAGGGSATKLVSVGMAGAGANSNSEDPAISATGRYVVFRSNATNLVPDDLNGRTDIFIRDIRDGTTRLVSVSSTGEQANASSEWPKVSGDGQIVAFETSATNLVPDDTNTAQDIIVRNLRTNETRRVSVSTRGAEGNEDSFDASVSHTGRFVAFASTATNLVRNDENGSTDVFVRDRRERKTTRVSVRSGGTEANGDSHNVYITPNGRFVVFSSYATNLAAGDTNGQTDVFIHDRETRKTRRISVSSSGDLGNGESDMGVASNNGKVVAFTSNASNLVRNTPNDHYHIYVRNLGTGKTRRVSVSSSGEMANNYNTTGSISSDGRYVAFDSHATNLVSGDTNGLNDLFVRDRQAKTTRRVNLDSAGGQANGLTYAAMLSADAKFVAFMSLATNLVPATDTNGTWDIFRRGVFQ